MNKPWHMNRMGFVNFWLYDEEIFDFANGKLLLRGQNASGKSITTQSFIPFILDGDKTPSRLDPFGSSDRKMEYYFLGDGEKEEATGYLFLEFKKEGTEQYKTIGIGQRARKGKGIGFWGFIILDGRRIGEDIQLYQEIGNKRIPYQKSELKKVLGDENRFTESQTEYMNWVNKYIFGFPKLEQYDQFIRLLIKVRAPKLSKEFKPTKVYEVLNESLQTLSDEDLRAMIDAMEKMDDIQNKLENLKEAFKDIKSIRNEYKRYNQFILYKKATAYLIQKTNVDEARGKFDSRKSECKNRLAEIEDKSSENSKLRDEVTLLEGQRDSFNIVELEGLVDELRSIELEKKETENNSQKYKDRIEEGQNNVRRDNQRQREIESTIKSFQTQIAQIIKELDEYNKNIEFEGHNRTIDLVRTENVVKTCKEAIIKLKDLDKSVDEGVKALYELKEVEQLNSKLEEELDKIQILMEAIKEELMESERIEAESRDEIINTYYTVVESNQEMIIDKLTLGKVMSLVRNYSGARDFGQINNILIGIRDNINLMLKNTLAVENQSKRILLEDRRIAQKELENITEMKEAIPRRNERIQQAREVLQSKNIICRPFYETIEFAENISDEEQDLIEEQLINAGVLDALVVAKKDYIKAKDELKNLADTIIGIQEKGESSFSKLVVAEVENELKEVTKCILSNIYEEGIEYDFIIGKDGYFKNGILEGYSKIQGQAAYIGTIARKRKRKQLILEKEKEINNLNQQIEEIVKRIDQVNQRMTCLEDEYKKLPLYDNLDCAIEMTKEQNETLEKINNCYTEKEKELHIGIINKKDVHQRVISKCKGLPYQRTIENYEEIRENIELYKDGLLELEREITALNAENREYQHIIDKIEREEYSIDQDYSRLRKESIRVKELAIRITTIEEFLNKPENKEKGDKLKLIKEQLEQKRGKIRDNEQAIAIAEKDIERLTGEINKLKENTINLIDKENRLRSYFEEEVQLGLILKRESKSLEIIAKEAISLLHDDERSKSIGDMTAMLLKSYQKHNSSLISYGTALEDCFDDDFKDPDVLRKRQCIVSIWQGKKLYLEEFYQMLKESIESTELLIQDEDRRLFENILADTLSRKLNSRIMESRRWIQDMSQLMIEMETSMALTFSLDWKPKKAESDLEIDTNELEKLLNRDRELLTTEDIDKVSSHFRNKIHTMKKIAEENGEVINYSDLVRDALDYRKWFEFRMYFYRKGENKKELTNSAFNKFSGGEKAMAMYVPLFAALNAQYKKCDNKDHPRIVALDEAFAGVDEKNINSMFQLVEQLKFDYIMNSQALWGCYESVNNLRIVELYRPANSSVVSPMYYYWNGRRRIFEER